MSSGERVLDMMAQLDEHSDKIPEGMYLQFCDHLKFFYQNDENIKKRLEAERLAVETRRRLANAREREAERERLIFRGSRRCGVLSTVGAQPSDLPPEGSMKSGVATLQSRPRIGLK